MMHKTLGSLLTMVFILGYSSSYAEKHQYPKLKPTGAPCLFLLDDEGNETTTVANPPCETGGTIINPGNSSNPVQKATHNQAKPAHDLDSDGDSIPTGKVAPHNSTRSNRTSPANAPGDGCDDDCDGDSIPTEKAAPHNSTRSNRTSPANAPGDDCDDDCDSDQSKPPQTSKH